MVPSQGEEGWGGGKRGFLSCEVGVAGGTKTFIKDLMARTLLGLGVTLPSRRRRGRLVIVTFHRVLPRGLLEEYPFPGLAMTPEEFEWHLLFLRRWFRCMTLEDVLRTPREGWREGKPLAVVTFDDGRRDNFSYAAPILKKCGIPSTFFVTAEESRALPLLWHDRIGYAIQEITRKGEGKAVSFLEENGIPVSPGVHPAYSAVWAAKKMTLEERDAFLRALEDAAGEGFQPAWDGGMDGEQLRALANEGHEIGSHSMTHPILTGLEEDDLEREVGMSKRILEQVLGRSVPSFSYPNGDHDETVLRHVRKAGYSQAVTTVWGDNGPFQDAYRLRRFEMDPRRVKDRKGRLSPSLLSWRMSGFYPGLKFK